MNFGWMAARQGDDMPRERQTQGHATDGGLSIIGPGMTVVGDLVTDGTLRVEGRIEGNVRVAGTVVIGKDGVVTGEIVAQDAVVSGTVDGSLTARSRIEVHASARVAGDLRARSMQLDEGAILNGSLAMGPEQAHAAPTLTAPGGPEIRTLSGVEASSRAAS